MLLSESSGSNITLSSTLAVLGFNCCSELLKRSSTYVPLKKHGVVRRQITSNKGGTNVKARNVESCIGSTIVAPSVQYLLLCVALRITACMRYKNGGSRE